MTARRSIWILALAAALTALLAGACSKAIAPDNNEDDGWTNVGGDLPISFSSSLDVTATKGTLPANSTFGVFAYYTKTSNWNGNFTPDFMYNEDVSFDGTSYTYSPIKYWPNNTNEKITFWAYYPYSASAVLYQKGKTTAYNNTTKNLPDIRFTVTDGQTDFMISNVASNKTKPALDTPVELTFNHALSRISFYVKKVDTAVPEKYTVKLKSVRLDGIYLTATHKNTGTVGWADWATRGRIPTFTPATSSEYLTLTTSYPSDGSPQAVSMAIPQDLSYEYAMLHIEYTIDFDGLLNTRTMITNIPLSTVFDDGDEDTTVLWQKGKEYRVNISITPDDPIEFSVTWSNWGTVHNINC